jgi:hypothetical protein
VRQGVAASTQNQAFNALLFFYRHVLGREFGKLEGVARAKRRRYVPVVLSRAEVGAVLSELEPRYRLVALLLYGRGLRLSECLGLRVQCFNLDAMLLTVHDGKGQKDRTVPLPERVVPGIREQMERVRRLHREDLAAGYGGCFAAATRAEIQERGQGVHLAIVLSGGEPDGGSRSGREAAVSPARFPRTTRHQRGGGDNEAGFAAHVPAYVRESFVAGQLRSANDPAVAWPQRREDHDDLSADRSERDLERGEEPVGSRSGSGPGVKRVNPPRTARPFRTQCVCRRRWAPNVTEPKETVRMASRKGCF